MKIYLHNQNDVNNHFTKIPLKKIISLTNYVFFFIFSKNNSIVNASLC